MNRLEYWLKSWTGHNLHSPWMFRFYNDVLASGMPEEYRGNRELREAGRGRRVTAELIYKTMNYFGYERVTVMGTDAQLPPWAQRGNARSVFVERETDLLVVPYSGEDKQPQIRQVGIRKGGMIIVERPHADRLREVWWNGLYDEFLPVVSVDMYDVGMLIFREGLHPQKFILRQE